VRACLDRSRPAGELVGLVGLAPASVSEHLKVLRKAGVLMLDKRGRFWLYRTNPEVVRKAALALGHMTADSVSRRA
jgi:DNA-binding transcriptional ArsR family regulator